MRDLPIVYNREDGGRLLRLYWEERARMHPHPKESWLTPWHQMDEWDKETDRYMWDHLVAPYVSTVSSLIERNQRLQQDIMYYEDKVFQLERAILEGPEQVIFGGEQEQEEKEEEEEERERPWHAS